ncbi:hypothetical protein QWY85_02580 [Neolewinella lacunae]|uniref:Uncharacterized protein n=1 Tax=Neolewinella lacunae TaxID=1517758 RepID=A0A923PH69_9BACT|nr:hypothetical protein [Neolewinella lacunae]MBC6992646.1 hypothetical protein [Neolewinella lacunae]MDN3633526.1 hypothetical protein [Neolewinella lacunae]
MRYVFFLFLLLVAAALPAQSALHLDRPFHIAGEVTWFSVYLPQPAPPKVRVGIYAPDGSEIDYFFLATDAAGRAAGHYRWPFALKTGYYRLALSARTGAATTADLGTFQHPVYENKRPEAGALVADPAPVPPTAGALKLTLAGNRVTIDGLENGAYSVSVFNADLLGTNAATVVESTTQGSGPWRDTLFYPARALTAAAEPFQTNLLPVFDPARFAFGFAKTEANGDFSLELPGFEGQKTVQARALEGIDLRPSLLTLRLPALTQAPPLTQTVATYLDLYRRRQKIYQLFATVETELEASPAAEKRKSLKPNRDFAVQDYKAFPDMYTFFKEVAGELRVRLKKEQYSAQLYNAPNQRFFAENPLYIVDGKLTRDDNYVNRLSPAEVSYLAFYYVGAELRRDFPALGNNGVVQIETLRPAQKFPAADADDLLTVKGLQPSLDFPVRRPAEDDVPALSPLLYWTTGSGTASATFELPATDDYGNYRVVVVARSATGQLVSASHLYEVMVK